jgi:hypothetical protein
VARVYENLATVSQPNVRVDLKRWGVRGFSLRHLRGSTAARVAGRPDEPAYSAKVDLASVTTLFSKAFP